MSWWVSRTLVKTADFSKFLPLMYVVIRSASGILIADPTSDGVFGTLCLRCKVHVELRHRRFSPRQAVWRAHPNLNAQAGQQRDGQTLSVPSCVTLIWNKHLRLTFEDYYSFLFFITIKDQTTSFVRENNLVHFTLTVLFSAVLRKTVAHRTKVRLIPNVWQEYRTELLSECDGFNFWVQCALPTLSLITFIADKIVSHFFVLLTVEKIILLFYGVKKVDRPGHLGIPGAVEAEFSKRSG